MTYKIGDRVKGIVSGHLGTVTEAHIDNRYSVRWDGTAIPSRLIAETMLDPAPTEDKFRIGQRVLGMVSGKYGTYQGGDTVFWDLNERPTPNCNMPRVLADPDAPTPLDWTQPVYDNLGRLFRHNANGYGRTNWRERPYANRANRECWYGWMNPNHKGGAWYFEDGTATRHNTSYEGKPVEINDGEATKLFNLPYTSILDFEQPLELDDGTPVTLRALFETGFADFILPGNHPAQPNRYTRIVCCRVDTGLVMSSHKFHVRNKPMPKTIDVTKPLRLLGAHDRDAVFITVTSPEGHILVSDTIERHSAQWLMFDTDGNFVRSNDGSGNALRLGNKIERKVHKVHIWATDGGLVFTFLRSDHSSANLEVITEGDKIVSITPGA